MVNEKLATVFKDVFELDASEIKPDTNPEDIENWDSMGHLQLILKIEEVFDVKFPTDSIADLTSVKKIQKKLQELNAI